MVDSNELKHVGVVGMRWGVRRGQPYRKNTMLTKKRQAGLDKKELSSLESKKGFRSAHQKKLDAKKIEVLKKRLSETKNKKLSYYERNKLQQQRARKAALAITGLYLFGKPLYKMARGTARAAREIGIPVAKQFVREGARAGRAAAAAKWATRGLHFAKGAPAAGTVVVDSAFVNVGKKLLLGAGY